MLRLLCMGGLLAAPQPWGASGERCIACSLLTWPAHAVPEWHSMGHRQLRASYRGGSGIRITPTATLCTRHNVCLCSVREPSIRIWTRASAHRCHQLIGGASSTRRGDPAIAGPAPHGAAQRQRQQHQRPGWHIAVSLAPTGRDVGAPTHTARPPRRARPAPAVPQRHPPSPPSWGPPTPEPHRGHNGGAASGRTAGRGGAAGAAVRPAAGGGARAHAPALARACPPGREKRRAPGRPGVEAPTGPTTAHPAHTGHAAATPARARGTPRQRQRASGAGWPSRVPPDGAREGPSSSGPTGDRAGGARGLTPPPPLPERCRPLPGHSTASARAASQGGYARHGAARSHPQPRARDSPPQTSAPCRALARQAARETGERHPRLDAGPSSPGGVPPGGARGSRGGGGGACWERATRCQTVVWPARAPSDSKALCTREGPTSGGWSTSGKTSSIA